MGQNDGFLAQSTELPLVKGQFAAANSVTTSGEQFVPPFGGSVTSVSVATWGILVTNPKTSIQSYVVQYTGHAGNNAGQTMTPKLYYLRGGVRTMIPGSNGSAINTNAGQKNGGAVLTTPFQPQAGDVILASLTASDTLSNALEAVMVALG